MLDTVIAVSVGILLSENKRVLLSLCTTAEAAVGPRALAMVVRLFCTGDVCALRPCVVSAVSCVDVSIRAGVTATAT